MNNDLEENLFEKKNIKIIIDSIKLKIISGDLFLYINHFIIKQENKSLIISINYKDITFYAIEKQKKMIILCDGKKYNIINIYLNNEEDTIELFNFFCNCIKDNNKKEDIQLDEDIDKENLLEQWEKKMVFNDNNEEDNYIDEELDKNKKFKSEINDKLEKEYESYNYENTIDKINFK